MFKTWTEYQESRSWDEIRAAALAEAKELGREDLVKYIEEN